MSIPILICFVFICDIYSKTSDKNYCANFMIIGILFLGNILFSFSNFIQMSDLMGSCNSIKLLINNLK